MRTNKIGERYGRLIVIERVGRNYNRDAIYLCRCDCGIEKTILSQNLGKTRSCGCLAIEIRRKNPGRNPVHGHCRVGKRTTTYNTWAAMMQRCNYPHFKQFKDYGGSGVTVCRRWHHFENFLQDMGERPAGKSIDRINPFGNYHPNNCRWATRTEQNNNTRKRKLCLQSASQ